MSKRDLPMNRDLLHYRRIRDASRNVDGVAVFLPAQQRPCVYERVKNASADIGRERGDRFRRSSAAVVTLFTWRARGRETNERTYAREHFEI